MTEKGYLNIVRAFGLYHAMVALPLAIPVVSNIVLALLGEIHAALALPGVWFSPHGAQMMFINLFGAGALVWGVFRAFYPSIEAGRLEGWGMLLFSGITVFYVVNGASVLWLVIPLVDLPGGVLHLRKAARQ